MKNILKFIIAIFLIATTLQSCHKSDETISGTGNLKVQFENGFAENTLILSTSMVPTSLNEVLKISKIKFIVSNIVLTKTDGTTITYPKSQSYFIVDESIPASLVVDLNTIPAGDYKTIKFGIGVDPTQYNSGQTNQGNLWTTAQNADMTMTNSWSDGYKFVAFEGTFTSNTISNNTNFRINLGFTATNYNYKEISLDLPTNALVRTNITPQIHLSTDLSKIIDGTNKINLTNNSVSGVGTTIVSGTYLPMIATNISMMFSVEHVHNDLN